LYSVFNHLAKAPWCDLVRDATWAASLLNLLVAYKLKSEHQLHVSHKDSQSHPQQQLTVRALYLISSLHGMREQLSPMIQFPRFQDL
jgi:hypothetical protein